MIPDPATLLFVRALAWTAAISIVVGSLGVIVARILDLEEWTIEIVPLRSADLRLPVSRGVTSSPLERPAASPESSGNPALPRSAWRRSQ